MINTYFKQTDKIEMCQNNIAYTNKACKEVSKQIRDMKGINRMNILQVRN